jgi:GT2 family glycosyltransferase/Tfp pilus assembly protein PilF
MRFSICIIEIEGYRFSHFLYDLCKYLCFTIEALGYDCCMVKNQLYSDRINIILGTHYLSDLKIAQQIKQSGKYVILQSEVLREGGIAGWPDQSSYYEIYVPLMQKATAVWHGVESNEKYFAKLGIQAEKIPICGYLPALEEIVYKKKKKDIDFLYYGSITPHRRKLIDALVKLGGKVVCIFDEAAIFRNDYIARTRINLAPNQGPGINHITAKILYLLNNHAVVVAERCHEQEWVEHCFLSTDTEHWAELCMETLHRPDLDELADTFFENYKKLDRTALYQPLLDKLADKIPGGRRAVPTVGAAEKPTAALVKSDKTNANEKHPEMPEPFARLERLLKDQNTIAAIKSFAGVDVQEKPAEASIQATEVTQQFAHPSPTAGLVSIIILTHNRLEQTIKCVKRIRKHTPENHEIIFVDCRSTDKTVRWLKSRVWENKNYRLMEADKQGINANAYNQGIRQARGEFILLLDNDVLVGPDWLSGLLSCLNHSPETGIVGPMSLRASGIQQVAEEDYRSSNHLDNIATAFKEKYRHRRIAVRDIDNFCLLFRRKLVEDIGLMDESLGHGSVMAYDFCLRAALEGYKNYIAGDVYVHCGGDTGSSTGDKVDAAVAGKEFKWQPEEGGDQRDKLAALKAIDAANELFRKGMLNEAADVLIERIKASPELKGPYHELARMLIESGMFSDAFHVIQHMPEEMKKDLKSMEYTGYIKEGLGLYGEAGMYVKRLLSMAPDYAPAINLNGLLMDKKGYAEKAEELFEKGMSLDPGYGEPYKNLGLLRQKQGRHDEALSLLERAFILSPTVSGIINAYHKAARDLREFDRAQSLLREAANLYPDHKEIALLHDDMARRQSGQETPVEEAQVTEKKSVPDRIEKTPMGDREREIVENLYKQAIALQEINRTDLSIRELDLILKIDDTNPEIHNDIGVLYFQTGDVEMALHHLKKSVELDPDNCGHRINLASVYLETEHIDDAIKQYHEVIEREPHNLDAALILGRLCSQGGLEDAAKFYYGKVLAIDPDNREAKEYMAGV